MDGLLQNTINGNTAEILRGVLSGKIPRDELVEGLKLAEEENEYEVAISIKQVMDYLESDDFKRIMSDVTGGSVIPPKGII